MSVSGGSDARSETSIRALLAAEGLKDPVAAIRSRARKVVSQADKLAWKGPPFEVKELASLRGLAVTTSTQLLSVQDACVMPGQIIINGNKPRLRQRYSIAHEIAHTLFPDYEATIRAAKRLFRSELDHSDLEELCQIAAAEFLFPLKPFREALRINPPSIATTFLLADLFDASVEATARRLIDASDDEIVVLLFRPRRLTPITDSDRSRSERYHEPRLPLGVTYFGASAKLDTVWLPFGCTAPKGSAAERAWKRVSLARGKIVVYKTVDAWTMLDDREWSSEAATLPRGSKLPEQVLAILHPL